ncbi:hypothetical protein LXA43DRAFT_1088877 [Ganoderma leucocontextum]|nr:hypothetical protein LXA43DRAFT_1088877 [Ganoderma leucocontextum]
MKDKYKEQKLNGNKEVTTVEGVPARYLSSLPFVLLALAFSPAEQESNINLRPPSTFNTGAIAGGTAGGFMVGGILGALVVFLAARKKAVKGTDDGQRSIHRKTLGDTIMEEKARVAGLVKAIGMLRMSYLMNA